MNLLFVHEVNWSKKVVFDIHILAEAMSLRGWHVSALDYPDTWDANYKFEDTVENRVFEDAHVHVLRPHFWKVPVVSRMSAFISHGLALKEIIMRHCIDAIVLYSVPTNGLQTVYWAKQFDIPVVFRSIDALNALVKYPILRYPTKMMEKKVYSSVDRILTISPKLSEYCVGLGASPSNVGILPMPVDTTRFNPSVDTSVLRHRWGITPTDKVILFMGTLFKFSGLDGFIQRMAWESNIDPNIKMLIVGDGEQRKQLEQEVCILGLQSRVIFTGFQPYQDMPAYINIADVCVNPFLDNAITKDIFPGKTVQFLACGKPLVMRPLDGVKAVIRGADEGVMYTPNDETMVLSVMSLLNKENGMSQMIGGNGLRYVRQYHSHEKVAEQLDYELLYLMGKHQSENN